MHFKREKGLLKYTLHVVEVYHFYQHITTTPFTRFISCCPPYLLVYSETWLHF